MTNHTISDRLTSLEQEIHAFEEGSPKLCPAAVNDVTAAKQLLGAARRFLQEGNLDAAEAKLSESSSWLRSAKSAQEAFEDFAEKFRRALQSG
jgi:hypothetical protein